MNQEEKKIYPYDEALKASTEYFKGDTLAANVFLNKYAIKDNDGNLYEKTPEDMHHRIAKEFARIEKKYENPLSEDDIFSYLDHFKYLIPGGSPMSGIGNDFQKCVSLSNCFVIGNGYSDDGKTIYDSYSVIVQDDMDLSNLCKRRGGVGLDISYVRASGLPVNNSSRSSTGLLPIMERFSSSCRWISQAGRRGASIQTVSIKHPDAESFINAKAEDGKISGSNISIKLDDEFMHCAEQNLPYTQQYPVDSANPLMKKEVSASELWKLICHRAWSRAEPGVLFWDTIIRESVPDCYADLGFKTISTNPCGEISLCKSDSCRLLSINLFSFVDNPFTENATINFTQLEKAAWIGQRLLDDLVDLELEKVDNILEKLASDPEPDDIKASEIKLWKSIRDKGQRGRRTGLGITALGDMIAAIGLRYGTPEATEMMVKVQKTICLSAYKSSSMLAKERGSFPIYDYKREVENPFIKRLKENDAELYDNMVKYGRRNIACLTIAPTGSVSIMTQTSSGIEPVFMPVYTRRRKVNPNDLNAHVDFVDNIGDSYEEYLVFHPKFKLWMQINGYDTEKKYSQKEVEELISKSPYYKATANDIDFVEKVKMQGAVQKFVDHCISVTVNMPNNVSEETVRNVYLTAWKSGCKGCTIYRDGSRNSQPLSATSKKDTGVPKIIEERPKVLDADVIRFKNNKENWIAFVGKLDGNRPYEIFTGIVDDEEGIIDIPKSIDHGKISKRIHADGTKSYDFEFTNKRGSKMIIESINNNFGEYANYSKMLSSVLRYNMPMNYVFHLVDSLDLKDDGINSWKSGVKRALKKFIKDGTTVVGSNDRCPDCGEKLIFQDGCVLCPNCGYSKCG